MSMFSEITTQAIVKAFVEEIEKQLEKYRDCEKTTRVLREMGRFALSQLDWETPEWEARYQKLFED